MDLSDSDDELIPSANTFNAMFSRVQKQSRQVDVPSASSSSSNSSKKSSKKKLEPAIKKSSKRSAHGKSEKSTKKPVEDIESTELSEDTKKLLAEIDDLTTRPFRSDPLPIPWEPSPPTSTRSTRSKKSKNLTTTATSTTSNRRGAKKKDVIGLSDKDNDVEVLNHTFDESFNEDVAVVEPVNELCSLRIRWKNELLRFRVPKETKMSQIRMDLALKASTRADNLVILDGVNNEISDNIEVSTIPFGQTLEAFEKSTADDNSNVTAKNIDPNSVVIKLQGCGGYRERYSVVIKRKTHVKQLIEDYIVKFNLQGKRFKLVFDGDDLDETETPESLDLDHGDMIDVVEIQKQ